MYLGNNLQVAFPSYTNIDDISGSFNGSTTSFALTVNGSSPVPFPLSSNQCLISVNGVVQRPDDSGTEGFRLSGGNIIFSAAPGTGQDFFGVILAGSDYVNVGVTYPSGSSVLPSITFESDLDTGLYNPGANQLGITAGGTASAVFTATGYSFLLGSAASPGLYPAGDTNTGLYSPGADQLGLTTGGTARLNIESDGTLNVAGTINYETLVTSDDDIPNKKYVDDAITAGSITFPLLATSLGTAAAPTYSFSADTNTGIYSPGADQLAFTTGGTARLTLDSSGNGIFSGSVTAGGNFTLNAQSDLRFADADSSNWVAFQAPSVVSSNVTWTLPSADGTANQVLSTNGSGTLSWVTSSSFSQAKAYFFSGF